MTIESPFSLIEQGAYTYYAVQARVTHLSPWCKPAGPLEPVSDIKDNFGRPYCASGGNWVGCSGRLDHWAEPWTGSGNNYRPRYKKSHDEKHDVWAKTGGNGWWTLKYAILAMRRLQKASAAGKLNYRDGYGKETQAVRYEFRTVKIFVSKRVECVLTAATANTSQKKRANKSE